MLIVGIVLGFVGAVLFSNNVRLYEIKDDTDPTFTSFVQIGFYIWLPSVILMIVGVIAMGVSIGRGKRPIGE